MLAFTTMQLTLTEGDDDAETNYWEIQQELYSPHQPQIHRLYYQICFSSFFVVAR